MDGMSVAGRRGEISWKASLAGRDLAYDTWLVRFGLVVAINLGDAVHVWDIPQTKFGGPCKAVRLRPDDDFRRRTLVAGWVGLGATLACIALLLLALGLFAKLHFGAAAVTFLGSLAAGGLGFWFARHPADESRHRDVRLLLGKHEWGTSDPGTWSDTLVAAVVDPRAALGVESFAALAEQELAAGRWSKAMWAARLCAAAEDRARGEQLTDAILAEPAVAKRLQRVRKRPDTRDQEFGAAPGLRKWVTCEPVRHILSIR